MEIQYRRKPDQTCLVFDKECSPDPYAVRVLEENRIPGILEMKMISVDQKDEFHFVVTGYQPLTRLWDKQQISISDVYLVLNGIYRIAKTLEDYLIDASHIVLKPEFIFVKKDVSDIHVCCHPGYNGDFYAQIRELAQYFITKMDHSDREGARRAYEIYRITGEDFFNFEELLDMAKPDMEEPARTEEPKAEETTQESNEDGWDDFSVSNDRDASHVNVDSQPPAEDDMDYRYAILGLRRPEMAATLIACACVGFGVYFFVRRGSLQKGFMMLGASFAIFAMITLERILTKKGKSAAEDYAYPADGEHNEASARRAERDGTGAFGTTQTFNTGRSYDNSSTFNIGSGSNSGIADNIGKSYDNGSAFNIRSGSGSGIAGNPGESYDNDSTFNTGSGSNSGIAFNPGRGNNSCREDDKAYGINARHGKNDDGGTVIGYRINNDYGNADDCGTAGDDWILADASAKLGSITGAAYSANHVMEPQAGYGSEYATGQSPGQEPDHMPETQAGYGSEYAAGQRPGQEPDHMPESQAGYGSDYNAGQRQGQEPDHTIESSTGYEPDNSMKKPGENIAEYTEKNHRRNLGKEGSHFLLRKESGLREGIRLWHMPFVIGSAEEDSDWLLGSQDAGTVNVRLDEISGEYYLADLGTEKGVCINGMLIQSGRRCQIKEGDEILIAGLRYAFQ